MRKQETKFIEDQEGGVTLTCIQHGAIPGMRLMARLGKLLGPAVADIRMISNVGGTDVLPALSGLLERLDEDAVESLVCAILSESQAIANKRVIALNTQQAINDVFSGRYLLLLRSLAFALQVNYGDFLRGAIGTVPAPAAPENADKVSPST